MNGRTDPELLRQYAERHAEPAFDELVSRYVDLVYSAALRMVRDTHLAEDVTQRVFLALAQNAGQLTQHPVLSGWLHRTTQNVAANTVRTEVRRRAREQQAAVMNQMLSAEPEPDWEDVAAQLDAVLGELSEAERNALLLRYFERQSAREMARALGTSEEAAQKRVSRAVEHARELMATRGVAVSTGGLIVLLSANAVQAAPVGLSAVITTSAALAKTGLATLTTSAAAKTLAMTTLQKALIATTLAAAIGAGVYQARQASALRAEVKTLQQQLAAAQPKPPREVAAVDLEGKVQALETQKSELAEALTRSKAENVRLEAEGGQAKRSTALYKELVEMANAKELNPTNAYPTPRQAFVGLGRMGHIFALTKQDESQLSPAEKSARGEASINALAELPKLLKALKQFTADGSSGADQPSDEAKMDLLACVLYGALDLNEQQFNQVYDLLLKTTQQCKQKADPKDMPQAEAEEVSKQLTEQFKTELQALLTPEQNRLVPDALAQLHVQPGGHWGYSFNFSP